MKAWQDAASLVLAARHGQAYGRAVAVSPAVHNYKLLCLKRHQKSSFMPGLYVFPGGTVDSADASLKWREHFNTFGLDNDRLASLVPRTPSRPQLFQSRENELLKEISLRITAIRETFEECGILICRRDRDDGAHSGWAENVTIPRGELRTWQSKVHDDATEFLYLCRKFECYPDLWALHEWRDWLTPMTYGKRFDTVFYLACMSHMPYAEYEAEEMEDLKWDTPEKLSTMGITFPPPQQCEIAELTKRKSIDSLLDIAKERNKKGVELYLPVRAQMKDGTVQLLPGDTMYPREVNLLEEQLIVKSDITMAEFERITPIKNRSEFRDTEVHVIFTDESGENSRVVFPMPGYSKKIAYGNIETKNKL